MKNILIIAVALLLYSCGPDINADFTWSPINPKAGEPVEFTNLSEGAWGYSWNFGDMSIGDEKNPKHTYKNPGNYIIDLTATRGLRSDTKTVTIVVSQ
ncbi:MAG: PKD domain-containing protein [Bacteroidales bacterium]